ncbi:MAG: CvpA family protein [Fusobacterium gastrosuis]|uniref:CvpA family protein n=1 Tax=Fusobacterium gastrosuis TaxID=1755100 RepID=UPI001F4FA34A|nr:CvpA family protein [Fusobacterium gastrosuis]MDY4010867.1 CvpA family protein [Fusobacterium gastrosuis]
MYLDILILILIGLGVLAGLKNGIFTEIISLFGFIINIIITKIYTPVVLKFFKKSETIFGNNYLITYIVTFITVYLVISMILLFVKKALKNQQKGFLNRMLGGILGLLKGIVISIIVVVLYSYAINIAPSLEKYSENSRSIELFYEIIPNIEQHIPDVLIENFNKNATKKIIEKNINTVI